MRHNKRFRLPLLLGLTVALLFAWTAEARAHKFKCFATVEGTTVSGYAWFGGGGRPKNVPFQVLAPDGTVLYEGKTNENGEFSFEATVRCDLTIVVGGGEGHQARFTVRADELPGSLPAYGGKDKAQAQPAMQPETPTPVAGDKAPAAASSDEIKRMVAAAVGKQVAPLRIQLEEFKEEQRMQDVIGGIGYLLGAAGIAFYFLGVRKQQNKA